MLGGVMRFGMLVDILDMHGKDGESGESTQAIIWLGNHAGASPEAAGETDTRRGRWWRGNRAYDILEICKIEPWRRGRTLWMCNLEEMSSTGT